MAASALGRAMHGLEGKGEGERYVIKISTSPITIQTYTEKFKHIFTAWMFLRHIQHQGTQHTHNTHKGRLDPKGT